MSLAALGLVAAISGTAAGAPPHDADGAARAAYGPFGVVGRVSAHTDAPKAPIEALVNSGLAATTDGGWLRWKLIWRGGRPAAVEQLEALPPGSATPAGWNLPASRPGGEVDGQVAGETGCRTLRVATTTRGRIGAWNCASSPGTLLGRVSPDGVGEVEARLPRRYQAMTAEAIPHGGVSRVVLAGYDVASQCFDYLELGVGR